MTTNDGRYLIAETDDVAIKCLCTAYDGEIEEYKYKPIDDEKS